MAEYYQNSIRSVFFEMYNKDLEGTRANIEPLIFPFFTLISEYMLH